MNSEITASGNQLLMLILERFILDIVVLFVIIVLIYKRFTDNKENMFSFFLIGIMIFLICVLLIKVKIPTGIALGLFAIFSILRLRTRNLTIKDLSYLYAIMGISIINAMFDLPNHVWSAVAINIFVIVAVCVLEIVFREHSEEANLKKGKKKNSKKSGEKEEHKTLADLQLVYNNLPLLQSGERERILNDLSTLACHKVDSYKILRIDAISGVAELDLFLIRDEEMVSTHDESD